MYELIGWIFLGAAVWAGLLVFVIGLGMSGAHADELSRRALRPDRKVR